MLHRRARRWAVLAVLSLVATGIVAAASVTPASAADAIAINGTSAGRTFDGIGAISGGGGNSRLLIDYPEPYRSEILDYLFKPGYGASLQILKVEIGGDTNSTDGAESSHEHTSGDLNCGRGYEWWLMEQAKARNPNIKLYGLAWGAPGFLGSFFSTATVTYLMDWLGCAASNGLSIDYLGGWNERGYDKTFYENLHASIASHGYHTLVVGADSDWGIADAMVSDATFKASVDIIGTHYPCSYESAMTTCSSTANAVATGKQLWASENGSEDYNAGGAAVARAINRGYLDAKMTAYINWPLIASIYPNLPYATTALMVANQPWSGWFDVGKQLWASAHTTQVTQPGWKYVDAGSGYFGGNRTNGSYVSYQAPDHSAYSMVAETLDATAARTVSVSIAGGLPAGATVHVWASNFNSNNLNDYFVRQADITPSGGTWTATLQPGWVYSFTTTNTAGHGTQASPPQASLALPYSDSFDADALGHEPTYLAQQQGAFETAACGGGRSGQCVRQMAPQTPIEWDTGANPYTLLGDLGWRDYSVSTDALFEQAGSVQVMGRVGEQRGFSVSGINAYYLQVSNTGAWSIVRNDTNGTLTTLASGTHARAGVEHVAHAVRVVPRFGDHREDRRYDGRLGQRQLVRRRSDRTRCQRLPDRRVRQPLGDRDRHATDRQRVRDRQHEQRQGDDCREYRSDHPVRVHGDDRATVATDRRFERLVDDHERRLGPGAGRAEPVHDRRHPARTVDRQRWNEPAVAVASGQHRRVPDLRQQRRPDRCASAAAPLPTGRRWCRRPRPERPASPGASCRYRWRARHMRCSTTTAGSRSTSTRAPRPTAG